MAEKYIKIIGLFAKNRGKTLTIGREYLPEIIHEDGWQLNKDDGLPELKSIMVTTIEDWGVGIIYDRNYPVIKFYVPESFSIKPKYKKFFN